MYLPKTHPVFGVHPTTGQEFKYKCVSQYPLAQWGREERPYMTQADWCELVMRICQYDMTSLEDVFKTAEAAKDKPDIPM